MHLCFLYTTHIDIHAVESSTAQGDELHALGCQLLEHLRKQGQRSSFIYKERVFVCNVCTSVQQS